MFYKISILKKEYLRKENLALDGTLFLTLCLKATANEPKTIKDIRGNIIERPEQVSKVAPL